MQPIHELLARVRWDPEFARSRFEIGYWDRVAQEIQYVPLSEIVWDNDNPSLFDLVGEDGIKRSIPFHRVREVWRDGTLIWQRGEPNAPRRST